MNKLHYRHLPIIVSTVFLALSLAYLLKRSVLDHSADIDFRYIWVAGKLGASGGDPYSPRFAALGRALFPQGNAIAYWFYPPQWWAISQSVAVFPIDRAVAIWRAVNAALLVAAASALAFAVRRARPATPLWSLVLLVGVIASMEGAAQTLLLGQTSILVFAGFCLMGWGLLTAGQWRMATGLVLLLLKPQFAFPAIFYFAFTKKWRKSVLIALAITGVASLPQLLQFGLLPTVAGMLGNIALHGQLAPNRPENLVGFSHLVWEMSDANLANARDIALDAAASLTLALLIGRRWLDVRDGVALGIGFIASAMFFLPVHAYDSITLGPLALLALMLDGPPRYLAWGAVALAWRPGFISAQFGDRSSGDLLLLSLAGLLALVAAATAAFSRRDERHCAAG